MRRPSQQLNITKKMIKNSGSIAILCLVSYAAHALIVPGSQITNIASGDYIDALGNTLVINSNPVSLTVQKVYALTLLENQTQVATLGAPVTFPHLLTNTGNSPDQYLLNLSQATSDFSLSGLAVYADRNQDGVADDNVNLNSTQISLNAGESLALVIVGSVPANASIGNQSSISLKATSQQNSALSQLVTDVVTVVDQAVINVTKSQSVSTGTNGTVITYTLAYTNTGTAAGRLTLVDPLDNSLTYQANSGTWSNGSVLTDADDTEAAVNPSNTGINYKLAGSQIEFAIANIAPLTTGSVSFKVIVKPTANPKIPNTASYKQDNGLNNTVVKDTKTNTVVFSLQQQLGVVLNKNFNNTNNAAADNLITKTGLTAGKPVIFDNYVWNTGNTSDTYNLTYTATNLPSCAQVQFVGADEQTPLTDSNGDGIVDTGSLAAGQARVVKVRVTTTPTCSSTNVINIDVVATSITNSAISDPIRNQINEIGTQGITDLYNANGSGVGVGFVDINGVALLSKPIVAGQSTVFPLVINNTGTINNNYTLYVSGTVIDLNNLNSITALPAGWSVNFFEGDATCTNLTQQIVNSGNIAAGTTKTYCAKVTAPITTPQATATQTSLPLWFAILSPINAQGDVVKDQVNLSQMRQFNLTNDQQGQIQIGGTAVYLHTLKNTGAVTEGKNIGDVLLSAQPLSATDGFSYSLYFDANDNGSLDSTDPIVTDLNSIAAGGLSPDQSVQLLIKVQAPSNATNGMASQVKLIVTPTGQVSGLSATSVQNTDTTTVNPNQLRLTKAQVKDAPCNSTNFASLTFGTTSVSVKPNQCVVYRLSVRNDGVAKVDNVKIQDTVPAYTSLRTPPGVSVTQGTVSISNGVQITGNVGSLMPQQEASLYFSILVNP